MIYLEIQGSCYRRSACLYLWNNHETEVANALVDAATACNFGWHARSSIAKVDPRSIDATRSYEGQRIRRGLHPAG